MRTAYVVLLLTMLSAASSYGFDIGISGGVRDWERYDGSVHGWPLLVLSAGRHVTPISPFRVEAVAGAWYGEEQLIPYDFVMFGGSEEDSRPYSFSRPGYMFGARAQYETQTVNARRVRPFVSAGLMWATSRVKPKWDSYWRDGFGAEGRLGLAIPFGYSGDVLIQYGIFYDINHEPDKGIVDEKDAMQYLTLGYRFRVLE